VVVSVEQALSMPYATLRFVHLGWRVIRLEPTPVPGRKTRGDPNRYVGRPFAGQDRYSYFVAPNAGKEAIAADLKSAGGKDVLRRLLAGLKADVFCTNTLPANLKTLGIDPETVHGIDGRLVWCGISAMGLKHPDVPGYDPMVQALCGFMDLTGHADGPPLVSGVPLVDLKAGDEAFAQVLLAMWEREATGKGKTIDVSMAHCAASWLQTVLPMLDMGSPPEELRRSGNEHRQFVPVNAYPVSDGYVYVALGSDAQWARIVKEPAFRTLDLPRFATNEVRRANRRELHESIAAITRAMSAAELDAVLVRAEVPHSPITPVEGVWELPFVKESALRTRTPDGKTVRLPPLAASTPFVEERGRELPFPPAYGEHTDAVLAEAGFPAEEIQELRAKGVVA
jgi:crotonobetainyl-CoA:carnitine CoA-transferase CaiB-like acyl-CoA transferase